MLFRSCGNATAGSAGRGWTGIRGGTHSVSHPAGPLGSIRRRQSRRALGPRSSLWGVGSQGMNRVCKGSCPGAGASCWAPCGGWGGSSSVRRFGRPVLCQAGDVGRSTTPSALGALGRGTASHVNGHTQTRWLQQGHICPAGTQVAPVVLPPAPRPSVFPRWGGVLAGLRHWCHRQLDTG